VLVRHKIAIGIINPATLLKRKLCIFILFGLIMKDDYIKDVQRLNFLLLIYFVMVTHPLINFKKVITGKENCKHQIFNVESK
jgi:hypothetical protein